MTRGWEVFGRAGIRVGRGKSHPGDFGVMRETRGAKMPEELLITSVAATYSKNLLNDYHVYHGHHSKGKVEIGFQLAVILLSVC